MAGAQLIEVGKARTEAHGLVHGLRMVEAAEGAQTGLLGAVPRGIGSACEVPE